jgi:uncharacterized cupin superfamily protein
MRISKHDLPVKIDAPGARACQQTDFGDAAGLGMMGAEHFSMAGGTDITPLLKGLEDDTCLSPHWGYLIQGELKVIFKNGQQEEVRTGDMFYWPPGHTVQVREDAEFVLFSPQHEHTPVLEHIRRQVGG